MVKVLLLEKLWRKTERVVWSTDKSVETPMESVGERDRREKLAKVVVVLVQSPRRSGPPAGPSLPFASPASIGLGAAAARSNLPRRRVGGEQLPVGAQRWI